MNSTEIRSLFLNYFKKNGHSIVESSSLVPQNDPTLLFTNAGMVQFKDVFLGAEQRPYKRATTSQKCVRAGGKHNDLENVGFTARHHTFFEMLGNFSFGDYFKKDAIHYAWEFVTKDLALPKDKLYVTVYKDDDEAADLWNKQEGVPKERISRFGEKDNFWQMGETGPCGPCSEIFIDRGKNVGCQKPTCAVGCDCDRFMEFWNLVFMQFERSADGKLTPLPKPSVDTGMGLERLASILQNVPTNYDTDLFQYIMHQTATLANIPYDVKSDLITSFRVIADHARATTFLIGDGVMPSNEGRGYVLRRIMRRAIRHGQKLGFKEAFFYKTTSFVISQMENAYPDLRAKEAFIRKAVQAEEEQFLRTLDRGLDLLNDEMKKLAKGGRIAGDVAFKLYDTYGFPLDLTRVIAEEKGFSVDEKQFETSMEHQRSESRKHWKGSGEEAVDPIFHEVLENLKAAHKLPEFVGYLQMETVSPLVGLLAPGADKKLKPVNEASAGEVHAVFLKTPFYGESGGQVGDRGQVQGNDGFEASVEDVKRPLPELIVARLKIKKGSIKVGQSYTQVVDPELRALTARNHTATHLLHWALRKTLGEHVKQAGSLVSPELLRFDFTHFQALTHQELTEIENMINTKIWSNSEVKKQLMKKDQAIAAGAIAFFGDKYGDEVRVISVGDFSVELCGGTHVDRSSDIAMLKIASESGIAAGVRRIIAYTSARAFEYLRKQDQLLKGIRDRLQASSVEEIPAKIDKLYATEKELKRALEKASHAQASGEVDGLIQKKKKLGSLEAIIAECPTHADGVKHLRDLAEQIQQKQPEAVLVLGMKVQDAGKSFLLAAKGKKAPNSFLANKVIEAISPKIEGRGGGKADLAQAGGTNLDGIAAALSEAEKVIGALS